MYSVFEKGNQVVYGMHGVCNILDNEVRMVNRKKVEYYVLQPVEQSDARFYVPIHNETAVAKMNPLLTPQGVESLLSGDDILSQTWISDENQRKQYYKSLIGSGDRAALIGMIRLLYQHKKAQQATGKKFHQSDENFLHDAEKLLGGEFSLVLGIPRSEVGGYIENALSKNLE